MKRVRMIWVAALAFATTPGGAAVAGDAMPMGAADTALMHSMDAMNTSMNAPMTGDPDKDFVTMMLPHHRGAVEMARVQLQYGKDPVLRAMAKDIIASQDKEIATMQAWQARHAK